MLDEEYKLSQNKRMIMIIIWNVIYPIKMMSVKGFTRTRKNITAKLF